MKVRVVVLAVAAAVAVVGSQLISTAGFAGDPPFRARTFAVVPPPDMPWGVVVDHGRVRVSTGAAFNAPFEDWRVFAFDERSGKLNLRDTVVIPRLRPVSLMGLANMVFDAQGRLYIADMNGRVLRTNLRTKKTDVALTNAGVIQVLKTNGKEERRFAADSPAQIAFDGKGSVYIASMETDTVLKALVNDKGYRIVRPRVP